MLLVLPPPTALPLRSPQVVWEYTPQTQSKEAKALETAIELLDLCLNTPELCQFIDSAFLAGGQQAIPFDGDGGLFYEAPFTPKRVIALTLSRASLPNLQFDFE